MDLEFILDIIDNKGYLGLFLWLWVGVFVFPIPNEVIVMTVGLAASMKVLHPAIAFLAVYLGIVAALTTCYTIGRFVGRPLLQYFQKRKRFSKTIDSSLKLMDKYHAFSLSLSYFIPGIRNFLPFLYGFSKLPFKTFALFAYSGALVWLTIAFNLGYLFGDHMDTIMLYGKEMLLGIILIVLFIAAVKIIKRKREKKLHDQGQH